MNNLSLLCAFQHTGNACSPALTSLVLIQQSGMFPAPMMMIETMKLAAHNMVTEAKILPYEKYLHKIKVSQQKAPATPLFNLFYYSNFKA